MITYLKTILVLGFLMSLIQTANALSVEAPGQIFYKMPSGEIVYRNSTLVVPMRGEGDVILKATTSEVKADKFWTEHSSGRAIFYVAFANPPGAPENTIVILKGSYLRGSNLALYYGDVFQKMGSGNKQSDLNNLGNIDNGKQSDVTYVGGFNFKTEIKE